MTTQNLGPKIGSSGIRNYTLQDYFSTINDQLLGDNTNQTALDEPLAQFALGQEIMDVGELMISTTVSTGVLPLATIDVVSTTGFASAGYAIVLFANGTQTVVSYTGVTGSPTPSLTGCTWGTGTLLGGEYVLVCSIIVSAVTPGIEWGDNAAPGGTWGLFQWT